MSCERNESGFILLPEDIYAYEDEDGTIFCFSENEKNEVTKLGINPFTNQKIQNAKWIRGVDDTSHLDFVIINKGTIIYKGAISTDIPRDNQPNWFTRDPNIAEVFACGIGSAVVKEEGYVYKYMINKNLKLINITKSNINYLLTTQSRLKPALQSSFRLINRSDLQNLSNPDYSKRKDFFIELNSSNLLKNDTVLLRCISYKMETLIMNWACHHGYDGFYSPPELLYCRGTGTTDFGVFMYGGSFIEELILCNSGSDLDFQGTILTKDCQEEFDIYKAEENIDELLNYVIQKNNVEGLKQLINQKGLSGNDITTSFIRRTNNIEMLRIYKNTLGVNVHGNDISDRLITNVIKSGKHDDIDDLMDEFEVSKTQIGRNLGSASYETLHYLEEMHELSSEDVPIDVCVNIVKNDTNGRFTQELIDGYRISRKTAKTIMEKIFSGAPPSKFKGIEKLAEYSDSTIDIPEDKIRLAILYNNATFLKFLREDMKMTIASLSEQTQLFFTQRYLRLSEDGYDDAEIDTMKEMEKWFTKKDMKKLISLTSSPT